MAVVEALIVFVSVVAFAVWLARRGQPRQEAPSRPQPENEVPRSQLTQQEDFAIRQGALLVDQINESLRIAHESSNLDTRRSRIWVARQKLDELKGLAARFPVIEITSLPDVLSSIEKIEARSVEIRAQELTFHSGNPLATARANEDLVKGLEFRATLQMRTPLSILLRNGEVHEDLTRDPPSYTPEGWEGIWVPKLKTWGELGCNLDVPEYIGASATDIGHVENRGEAYRRFLIAIKTAEAEAAGDEEAKAAAVALEASRPEWSAFTAAHGGAQAVVEKLMHPSPPARKRRRSKPSAS